MRLTFSEKTLSMQVCFCSQAAPHWLTWDRVSHPGCSRPKCADGTCCRGKKNAGFRKNRDGAGIADVCVAFLNMTACSFSLDLTPLCTAFLQYYFSPSTSKPFHSSVYTQSNACANGKRDSSHGFCIFSSVGNSKPT